MTNTKGVILAGGMGSRLLPLTENDNKHYLPVYNQRMVEIPLRTLVSAGIKDIVLITGGKKPGQFLELFKNGKSWGINRLFYTYQEGSGGIADALSLAEPFLDQDDQCLVILGDNYYASGIQLPELNQGAHCWLKKVQDARAYGVAGFNEFGEINSIEEKPQFPKSDLAITGCYLFDSQVWSLLKQIEPSARGELEITDVLNLYLKRNQLSYTIYNDIWSDMGTFDGWLEVSKEIWRRSNESK